LLAVISIQVESELFEIELVTSYVPEESIVVQEVTVWLLALPSITGENGTGAPMADKSIIVTSVKQMTFSDPYIISSLPIG
jgi:hypothetical protein